MCVDVLYYFLSETYLILRRVQGGSVIRVHIFK